MLLIVGFSAIVTIITIYICYFYNNSNLYKINRFLKQFPSPPSVPFFCNALDFTSTADLLKILHKYKEKFGNMVSVRIGPTSHFVLCTDLNFSKFILSSNTLLNRPTSVRYLESWLGNGLITADGGPKWKAHRKLVNSMFHYKILKEFVAIFETQGDILVAKFSKNCNTTSVDVHPYISLCTLDIICEAALGTKVNAQYNEFSDYFQSVKDMLHIYTTRATSVLLQSDWIYKFTKLYSKQKKALMTIQNYTNQIINEKLKNLKKENFDTETTKSFLDLLLEATIHGKNLSHEELREAVSSLMFAGHDTTAAAISFILYSLANYREEQTKVFEEQQKLFGPNLKNVKVSYENLNEMRYLDMVIKEGLRLYTPVPIFGRETDKELDYDGNSIPKGVNLCIFAHGIHMNPEYYPNPEKFDPSRFENSVNRPSYTFIPFSAGPRNCIGEKFAILETKSLVSKIIRNFELFPAIPEHRVELASLSVLKSLNGIKMGLKLRSFV